ncbi:MAG: hypothetical protein K2K57_03155 [Oscillospiraceae bacterium]|nr:hypothetical protein [Oscillospiraceae bacterium]
MTNKKLLVCNILLAVIVICSLLSVHHLKEENEYLLAEAEGVFRKADADEYYLNDGLYYLNGDTDSCYFKVEKKDVQNTIQLIVEDKDRFHELYKAEITDVYNPDSTKYKDYEQWFNEKAEYWSYPQNYCLIYNEILNPETINVGYNWGFNENMKVELYLSCADYVDRNTIQCETASGEYLVFTNISE